MINKMNKNILKHFFLIVLIVFRSYVIIDVKQKNLILIILTIQFVRFHQLYQNVESNISLCFRKSFSSFDFEFYSFYRMFHFFQTILSNQQKTSTIK